LLFERVIHVSGDSASDDHALALPPFHFRRMDPAMPATAHAIVIRPVRAADTPAVAHVYEECIRDGEGVFDDTTSAEASARRFRRLLPRGAPFLVAIEDGQVVGFAHVTDYLAGHGFDHCMQSAVWILPSHRGEGLGWALLRDLLVACKAAGLRQLVAYLRADSEAALALHAGLGFGVIGWHREACEVAGRMHDLVVMGRMLDRMGQAVAPTIMRRPDAAALSHMAGRMGLPLALD
jgi:phosphinothricin acetyltransferase